MQDLIGVKFMPQVSQKCPWRAQVCKGGRAFYLGLFPRSDTACRAYDNAAYYLKAWGSTRMVVRYNFPQEWEGAEIPPILPCVIKIRDTLRRIAPGMEEAVISRKDLKDSEYLELSTMEMLDSIHKNSTILQRRFADAISRLKLLEARLEQSDKDQTKKDNIIAGLRVQGGLQFFKKVNNESVPISQIEADLQ